MRLIAILAFEAGGFVGFADHVDSTPATERSAFLLSHQMAGVIAGKVDSSVK